MTKLNENHELMADGKIDIEDPQVLVALNAGLAEATMTSSITPYVAWARVQKVLATYHVFIPNAFLEGADGHEVMPINQFGKRFGQTNDGDFVVRDESDLYLYFEWEMNDSGLFKIFAEVVNSEDLDQILSDYDEEVDALNEEMDRSEKRMKELRNTRNRIMAKVNDKINKRDKYLSHERGYAKRGMKVIRKIDKATTEKMDEDKDPCWKGYEMVGMKKKKGKPVPNCVPVSEAVFGGKKYSGRKPNPNNKKSRKTSEMINKALQDAYGKVADLRDAGDKHGLRNQLAKGKAAFAIGMAKK